MEEENGSPVEDGRNHVLSLGSTSRDLQTTYLIISLVLSVGCGLLLILLVWKKEYLRKPSHYLRCNLAVDDIIFTGCLIPIRINALFRQDTRGGQVWCAAEGLLGPVCFMSMYGTYLMMAVDLYYFVCDPLHHHDKVTTKRVILGIFAFRAFSIFFGIAFAAFVGLPKYSWRCEMEARRRQGRDENRDLWVFQIKAFKMMVPHVIVLTVSTTTASFYAAMLLTLVREEQMSQRALIIAERVTILLYLTLSSVANPLIYSFRLPELRRACKELCGWPNNPPVVPARLHGQDGMGMATIIGPGHDAPATELAPAQTSAQGLIMQPTAESVPTNQAQTQTTQADMTSGLPPRPGHRGRETASGRPLAWEAETYIGETERSLKARFLEHRRPSSSTSEVSQHIHIESPGHTVTLDKVRILDTEQDYFVRGVKEAIYIRAHQPSLNRDGGRYRLPATFDALLTSSRFRLPENKPGIDSITGVCVVCEVQNEDGASKSPFRFLAGVDEVAIKGYPFHVISAEKLAQLDSSEIDTLALIDAKIVDVKNNTFSEFSRLRKMSLDSNRLTDVKQTWFTGLESLFALILSNNSIRQIEPGSFVHLTSLQLLDLENNMLQAAPVVVLASKASMADKLDTNAPELCRQVWEYDGGIAVALMSYTTVQDLEVVQAPDRVLIPITVSTAVVLVMSFLALLLWRLCAARLNSEDDRASDDTHVWTIPPGVAFPGLLRSASLPTYSDKMASNDAVSCRSLPAVLHSIEPTYSEIPDDEACAHGEVHGLQHVPVPTHTYSEIPDDDACAQGHLHGFQHVPVLTHTYSEIPDCADGNRRQDRRLLGGNRITSSRQRSGSSIVTYGSTGQANDQRNPYYRNPSLAQGIRARRQLRTALVSRPDQDVRTYVNVTDAIMSGCIDIRRAHIAFLTLPNTYWSWENLGQGSRSTAQCASLPTVTLPDTYWPWEIPGEGTNFTRRPVSLPTVTLPNTYWPWEIPGEGTRNTPRRASLPTVTLPNTYWPWEVPGEGTRNTARRASLPDVTLPNTYWPWEIPGDGTQFTRRRVSLPTVTLPNTYWPWEIPGKGTFGVSLPTVTLPNTYWPWEIPGEGIRNPAWRASKSLPTVTLPNTYWPLEIAGKECRYTARRASLPTVTLPNTYWPWEIPGEGTRNTARRASLPTVTIPNTYWPWEIPGEVTRNTARRASLHTVTPIGHCRSQGSINQIEPGSFMNLRRLRILDLENNLLQVVDPSWLFGLEGSVMANTDLSVVNIRPGISCGNLDNYLSKISIQAPVVVLASDDSLEDKLDTNTLQQQCRQVWEYDGGISMALMGNLILRLVSMATGSTNSEGVAMSFVQTPVTSTHTTTKSGSSQKHTTNTNITHDNTKNITCILLIGGEHTKLFYSIPLVKSHAQTTETSYKIVSKASRSLTYYSEPTEKDDTSSKLEDQSTLEVSTTPGPDLEIIQTPDHVLKSVVVSALVMSALAGVMWKVCVAWLNADGDRDRDNACVSTITFPGLLRSASLPARLDKTASDDAVSCRSLPAVLHSIKHTYSEIPDDVACAQGPQHGLPHVPVPTHSYSQIPDNEHSGPMPLHFDAAEFPLGVVINRRPNRQLFGDNRITNVSQVEGLRARRQLRAALVPRPCDQGITTYVNATDAIMSRGQDVTRAHITFLTLPNTHWSREIQREGTYNTPRRASLPDITLPNTYWPWEIPGEGTSNTARRASLPTVTLPNTYWPWEIPGEGTSNTARRASLPTVTLPNTYWPWEIPGEGNSNTARRASLPTVTLPNTYWPWEIPGKGTSNTARRASLPTVTLPNTYWPWEIPGEGTSNTPRRASLPTVTLPNTYWPWEVPGEGTSNTARRASLPTVTLPNTYWPWEIPGEGTRNTARRVSLPTVTLPNTYWPWEIPGEGTSNTPRRASLPTVTLPNTYWPWEIPGEGTRNTARRVSLPTVTLPNTYWPWEIPGEGTSNTPRRASLPTVTLPNTYWPWEIPGEGTSNTARRASLPTVTLPNTYWPWEVPGEGTSNTARRASLPTVTLPNTYWPWEIPGEGTRNITHHGVRPSPPSHYLTPTGHGRSQGDGRLMADSYEAKRQEKALI
ncbi:hypothetical protein Bbelb_117480 [Branchiostoma belcheri]|nr:hypothetical protein Bbelb_117480 [Branchiostoma belcheri]